MATQLVRPSRIERGVSPVNKVQNKANAIKNFKKRGVAINFLAMVVIALVLDILSFFLSEIPGVGLAFSVLSLVIFIPWFAFSGIISMNDMSKIVSIGLTALGEGVPFLGNAPFITANVFFTYYS